MINLTNSTALSVSRSPAFIITGVDDILPDPDIDLTSGFPSQVAITPDMSDGFTAIWSGVMAYTGTDYQMIGAISNAGSSNQVRLLHRLSTNKMWFQLIQGGSKTDFPLEWADNTLLDGEQYEIGMTVGDNFLEFYIDGVMVAWIDTAITMPTDFSLITTGQNVGGGNAFGGVPSQTRAWYSRLTRRQIESETFNNVVLTSPVHDPNNKFAVVIGDSVGNGVESPSTKVNYFNTIKQFGKDLATGIKTYAVDDIVGDDTSTWGSLFNTSTNGFSGIGKLCDLKQGRTGNQYVAVPMAQGGLLLSEVASTNNMNAKQVTGIGFFINPRIHAIIKTLHACEQLGVLDQAIFFLGRNDSAQGVAGATFSSDLDNMHDYIRYYFPSLHMKLVGLQDWQSGTGVAEADWNDLKTTIEGYSRTNVTTILGDWSVIAGNEIHLSERGDLEVYQAINAQELEFVPAGYKGVQIGTSQTDNGYQSEDETPSNVGPTARGGSSWARFLTNQNLDWVNVGVSGNKIEDMVARFNADVVSEAPDFVIVEAGTNDSGTSFEAITEGLTELYALVTDAGYILIPLTVSLRSVAIWDDTTRDKMVLVNEWIKLNYRNAIEVNEYFIDPATNRPYVENTIDGTHYTYRGGYDIGVAQSQGINIIGTRDIERVAINSNPDLTGITGTSDAGISGTVPDGIHIDVIGGHAGTMVTTANDPSLTMVITPSGVAGMEEFEVRTNPLNITVTAGEVYELLSSIEVDDWDGWGYWQLKLYESPYNKLDLYQSHDDIAYLYPEGDIKGLLRTPPLTATGTFFRAYLEIGVKGDAVGSGTIKMNNFRMQAVAVASLYALNFSEAVNSMYLPLIM